MNSRLRPAASFGSRKNALCLEDHLHGLPQDLFDTELAKLTRNAGGAPAVLASEPKDKFTEVAGGAGTPGSLRWLVASDVRVSTSPTHR